MRWATDDDLPVIEAFLLQHAQTSMFPLSNLRRHGLGGDHPRGMHFLMSEHNGKLTGVVGVSNERALFPQCPDGFVDLAPAFEETEVKGLLGNAEQVATLRVLLGLTKEAQLDVTEPGYALDLAALKMPDVAGLDMQPLELAPHDLLINWRAAYGQESLGLPGVDAMEQARTDIDTYIANDTHRVLLKEGVPVAMTGFNATLDEIVQIGGVYTPPDLRNRGYARAALALHLEETRLKGVAKAVLFAANEAAERAYRALGFARAGSFSVVIYTGPVAVHV